ncbi:hypothetical protein M3Y97_00952300 [Aphelenchoides bicaudatus]|nr:hypothetical protein M3Y97_00952300 [Aphelenchoides bicaudatus]
MKFVLFTLLLIFVDSKKLTNKQRKYILKIANKERSYIARGFYENNRDSDQSTVDIPPASNMYKLTYSLKLEKKAIEKAKTCDTNLSLGYTYYPGSFYYDSSEGLSYPLHVRIATSFSEWAYTFKEYRTTFRDFDTREVLFKKQPLTWTENSKDAIFNQLLNNEKFLGGYLFESVLGTEFGQFVWAKNKEIGCALQTCKNFTGTWVEQLKAVNLTWELNYHDELVVCAYKTKAKFGQKIYKKGKKLKCPKGSRPSKSYKRLCTVKGLKEIH